MRILLSVHHLLDPNAGAAGVTMRLAEAMRELGHSTDFLSMTDMVPEGETVGAHVRYPWFVQAQLRRRYRSYDVLDLSTGDGWIFQRTHRQIPQLVVTRCHGLEHIADQAARAAAAEGRMKLSWKYPLYHGGYRLWEVAQSLRGADLSLFLNQADVEYAVQRLGVAQDRARVVDNGIGEEFLGLPIFPTQGAGLRIAIVGSYGNRKIHTLPPVLSQLLQRHLDWRVGFFGTLSEEDAVRRDYANDVQQRIAITREYRNPELPRLLQGYEVLLFPSLSEGFGIAVFEAMACGLAPVASALPSLAERLHQGVDAWLFPPGDHAAVVNALETLAADRGRLEALRTAAHRRAQAFSWRRIAVDTIARYEEALARKRFEAR